MKVERKEKAFEPVVITLENEQEVTAITWALLKGRQDPDPLQQHYKDILFELEDALYEHLENT